LDVYGDSCEYYNHYFEICGFFDSPTFKANEMCCACKIEAENKQFVVLNNIRTFQPFFSTLLLYLIPVSLIVSTLYFSYAANSSVFAKLRERENLAAVNAEWARSRSCLRNICNYIPFVFIAIAVIIDFCFDFSLWSELDYKTDFAAKGFSTIGVFYPICACLAKIFGPDDEI
jgi:hypothetical protein